MTSKRKRLFLIDGYSNIFRAFYAIRGLSNSKGQPTNAVYGFLQMLRKLLRDEEPELIGVALDVSSDTKRKEKFEDYKANRTPMPEDLKSQIPWVRKTLEALKIPILELEKYEADDVLGTLARKAAAAGFDVVLVSADKDLMQLVGEHVAMYHTGREKLYDPELVEADFGVPPGQVIDVLALKGDAVDNVPGVPGIGEKGAVKLIREHGSLAKLLEHAGDIKRKSYREGLEKHRDDALMSLDLVTIETDLPLDLDPEGLLHEDPDPEALREIFRELEFFSLLEELEASGGAASGETLAPAGEAATPEEWRKKTSALGKKLYLAPVGPKPLGLAAAGEGTEVVLADFRRRGVEKAARASLAAWAANDGLELVGHDLKESLRLASDGEQARAALFDTLVVSFLLGSSRAQALEELSLERLGYSALGAKEAGWGKGEEPAMGSEPLLAFAGERVGLPRRMEEALRRELGGDDLARVWSEIEAPLVPVLLGMEETGVLLDTEFLAAMSKELGEELEGIEAEIYKLAGDPFNINSPAQLGEVMFERLGYPVLRKTRKTKSYSTNQATLEELAARGYELPEHVLRYRELSKLKSTYVDALPDLVAADGRLHTSYNQAGAATGRISSNNPNLQNIPIRTEQGQRIRRAFTAPAGRLLLVADYSQIELRVLAHIADEPALIAAFEEGADIHAATAAAVFDVDQDLVTAEQRRAAKVINFGILYGMSAFGLAQNLKIQKSEADRFIKTYLGRYTAVQRYMEETAASAREEGRVETLFGRVRRLPDIRSKNFHLRENAKRMAINARIQGTAADLLKMAMISVDRRLRAERPDSKLLLTVHDELVLEVPEEEAEQVAALVREEMSSVEKLKVPLVVDAGWGKSWYEAKG